MRKVKIPPKKIFWTTVYTSIIISVVVLGWIGASNDMEAAQFRKDIDLCAEIMYQDDVSDAVKDFCEKVMLDMERSLERLEAEEIQYLEDRAADDIQYLEERAKEVD